MQNAKTMFPNLECPYISRFPICKLKKKQPRKHSVTGGESGLSLISNGEMWRSPLDTSDSPMPPCPCSHPQGKKGKLTMTRVPDIRIQNGNEAPVRASGELVLYWMIAARRTGWNFGLQRAVERAKELDR